MARRALVVGKVQLAFQASFIDVVPLIPEVEQTTAAKTVLGISQGRGVVERLAKSDGIYQPENGHDTTE